MSGSVFYRFVKRLPARRRFNYDGLADVIKVSGVAQVDVPVYPVAVRW
jgi:hypothetical protein